MHPNRLTYKKCVRSIRTFQRNHRTRRNFATAAEPLWLSSLHHLRAKIPVRYQRIICPHRRRFSTRPFGAAGKTKYKRKLLQFPKLCKPAAALCFLFQCFLTMLIVPMVLPAPDSVRTACTMIAANSESVGGGIFALNATSFALCFATQCSPICYIR